MRAGIAAVDPGVLVTDALAGLRVDGRLAVIAAGKAAGPMATAASAVLGGTIRAGLVVTPAPEHMPPTWASFAAGHPVATAKSVDAGRAALRLAESLSADDTLLVLLSGGASALLSLPADGITLDDKQETTSRLLNAGADIVSLNVVRKHLSRLKGGWLAASTPARCQALIISDVVGDDLSTIASGPTVSDPSTFADALAVLTRCGGVGAYPPHVVERLSAGMRGEVLETPKPGDVRLSRSTTSILAGRGNAMTGAAREARVRGYRVVCLEKAVVGEARQAAPEHVRLAVEQMKTTGRLTCVVSSGETTVRVTGSGRGGRNQEFALAAAEPLASVGAPVVLISVGTDGIDGPTDAAGAVVDSTTCARAEARGLRPPTAYLDDNDSYRFFAELEDLVSTGPTGTNVGDLQIMLVGSQE